jgi:hypothetical protein
VIVDTGAAMRGIERARPPAVPRGVLLRHTTSIALDESSVMSSS